MNESIFCYDVSEEEMEKLNIRWTDSNEYYANTSVYEAFNDLYGLFKLRGNEYAAKNLLENSIMNNFVLTVRTY